MSHEIEKAVVDAFVGANWLRIAGVAWRAHLQLGLGVLLLDASIIDYWMEGRFVSMDSTMFVTMGESALAGIYNPATDVLLGFTSSDEDLESYRAAALDHPVPIRPLRSDEALRTWLYRMDPPPPEANRRTSA